MAEGLTTSFQYIVSLLVSEIRQERGALLDRVHGDSGHCVIHRVALLLDVSLAVVLLPNNLAKLFQQQRLVDVLLSFLHVLRDPLRQELFLLPAVYTARHSSRGGDRVLASNTLRYGSENGTVLDLEEGNVPILVRERMQVMNGMSVVGS